MTLACQPPRLGRSSQRRLLLPRRPKNRSTPTWPQPRRRRSDQKVGASNIRTLLGPVRQAVAAREGRSRGGSDAVTLPARHRPPTADVMTGSVVRSTRTGLPPIGRFSKTAKLPSPSAVIPTASQPSAPSRLSMVTDADPPGAAFAVSNSGRETIKYSQVVTARPLAPAASRPPYRRRWHRTASTIVSGRQGRGGRPGGGVELHGLPRRGLGRCGCRCRSEPFADSTMATTPGTSRSSDVAGIVHEDLVADAQGIPLEPQHGVVLTPPSPLTSWDPLDRGAPHDMAGTATTRAARPDAVPGLPGSSAGIVRTGGHGGARRRTPSQSTTFAWEHVRIPNSFLMVRA